MGLFPYSCFPIWSVPSPVSTRSLAAETTQQQASCCRHLGTSSGLRGRPGPQQEGEGWEVRGDSGLSARAPHVAPYTVTNAWGLLVALSATLEPT